MAIQYNASDYAYGVNPQVEPAVVIAGPNASGAGTVTVSKPTIPLAFGRVITPFAITAPITIGSGSVAETVTPSAVSTLYPAGTVNVTATFGQAHGQGALVTSGTAGLQEAINDAVTRTVGGYVVVDAYWVSLGGTTAMITAAVGGNATTLIDDVRGPSEVWWTWNGTNFSNAQGFPFQIPALLSANGAIVPGVGASYMITKGSACLLTLAAPLAGDAGKIIYVSSRTGFAHTITATGLLNTGSANVNVATFAAFAGANVALQADNLKWNVLWSTGITFS